MDHERTNSPDRNLSTPKGDFNLRLLPQVERTFLQSIGGSSNLLAGLRGIIRLAIEEVIDWPRTGRNGTEELEEVEVAYLGTKIEILLKHWLRFPKGEILDADLNGIEMGVRNIFGTRCCISKERAGHPLLVVRTDLADPKVSAALVVAGLGRVNLGARSESPTDHPATSKPMIRWLCRNVTIPRSAAVAQMALIYRRFVGQVSLERRPLAKSIKN